MSTDIDAQIAATLAQIHAHSAKTMATDDVSDMKVKELQLAGLKQVEQVMANDDKASVISVVVYIAVT